MAWTIACAHVLLGMVRASAADVAEGAARSAAPAARPPMAPPEIPATPPPNRAPMGPEAKAHYDRGLNLYAARQYAAAVAELRQGFAVEPRREFLFAEAQALRLAGECGQAIALYQQFIDSAPPPLQMQAARLGLDRCGPERARTGIGAPPVIASPPPVAPPARPRQSTAWWRDPWGDTALGAGIVALGVATGFEVASRRAQEQAHAADTYMLNDQAWTVAQHRRAIAVTAAIGGLVLVAGGGVRVLLWHGHEASARSTATNVEGALSVMIAENAASVLWRGAF